MLWGVKPSVGKTRSPLHFSGVLFARVKYYFIWLFAAWQCCLRLMKDPGPQKGLTVCVRERENKERRRQGERAGCWNGCLGLPILITWISLNVRGATWHLLRILIYVRGDPIPTEQTEQQLADSVRQLMGITLQLSCQVECAASATTAAPRVGRQLYCTWN